MHDFEHADLPRLSRGLSNWSDSLFFYPLGSSMSVLHNGDGSKEASSAPSSASNLKKLYR